MDAFPLGVIETLRFNATSFMRPGLQSQKMRKQREWTSKGRPEGLGNDLLVLDRVNDAVSGVGNIAEQVIVEIFAIPEDVDDDVAAGSVDGGLDFGEDVFWANFAFGRRSIRKNEQCAHIRIIVICSLLLNSLQNASQ